MGAVGQSGHLRRYFRDAAAQDGLHPRYCKGNLPKLAPSEILPYMCMQPGEALLQGEWEKHGACDFDTAKQYFEKERELFQALKLPDTTMPKE